MDIEDRRPYGLDELIKRLDDIRLDKADKLNYVSAFLCLAQEVKRLKDGSNQDVARSSQKSDSGSN